MYGIIPSIYNDRWYFYADLDREAQYKINQLTGKCARLSEVSGLPTKMERMQAAGLTNKNDGRIIKTRGGNSVNIRIDKFTPCLENAKTGEIVATEYSIVSKEILKSLKGWMFDWTNEALNNSEIYGLTISGSNEIQGLVAITKYKRDRAVYVSIAESAPHNLGIRKEYNGVGGHLFAIAAQCSVDAGYGGYVFMDAKNIQLVNHYREALGAILLGHPHPYRMIIDEDAAQKLLKLYTLRKGEL